MASQRQIDQRKKAGAASGEARRNRAPSPLLNPEAPLPESSIDVKAAMAAYVEMVGPPSNWQDVKAYVQVEGEAYKNLQSAMELATRSKRQWTSDQVEARDALWNEAVANRLDLVERLLDEVPGASPEQRRAFLDRARDWRIQTKRTLEGVQSHG